MNRRITLSLAGAPALTMLLAACGAASGGASSAGNQPAAGGSQIQPVIPSSDLAVGSNRLALALLRLKKGDASPTPLTDAKLNLKFFYPIQPQAVPHGGEATPDFRFVDDKTKGLYVAQAQFDQPGVWGVQVTGTGPDGAAIGPVGVQFQVKPKSETPAIGSPAPRSRNLTRYDVDDIKKIDSGLQPNDMHELTIAGAIEQKKPLVVAFASPGFCVTATCAPELGEVQKLEAKYRQQANFIHVEIYKDPMTRTPYETVVEWGLPTDPWVFLVDRDGLIAAKFEGPAPVSELEPALQKLL
jgi:hypothetical protein